MTGEEKLNDELFYVQDLQQSCFFCDTKHAVSVYDDFSFHWLVPPTSMVSLHIKQFEDQLTNDSSSTIGVHAGCYSLESREYDGGKSKYKIGSPMLTLPLDIDKIVSKHNRIFVNNLYRNVHRKIYPLPLGIFRKEIADFTHLRQKDKESLCYANFSITQKYRYNVIEWAVEQDYIDCRFTKRFPEWDNKIGSEHFSEPLAFEEFLSVLSSYRFCIVPNGVGIDTDRLWECIYMNVVPIVQNNYGNRIFSKIWPMILVDRYEVVDLPKLMADFEEQYGKDIQYNHDLLLRKNLPELLNRIECECRKV
tara:strand:- start:79 stop:999 length:921 start_codon:yes stop_codon:yes gene_type:complete